MQTVISTILTIVFWALLNKKIVQEQNLNARKKWFKMLIAIPLIIILIPLVLGKIITKTN